MRKLELLGWTVPAGSAVLMLAACGTAPSPTTADPAARAAAVTEAPRAATQQPSSITVRGRVVDAANRPLAGFNVECNGDVQCVRNADISAEDGPDEGVKTNANGSYSLVATQSGGSGAGFLMNASGSGFQVAWHDVAFPGTACSFDQPGCSLTVDFVLTPQDE